MCESTTPTAPSPKIRPSSEIPSLEGKLTASEPSGATAGVGSPPPHAAANVAKPRIAASTRPRWVCRRSVRRMRRSSPPLAALLTALPAGLLQELLVLLLPHLLAALLDERRQAVSLLLSRSEQVPEVHALRAVALLEANGPQSKRLRPRCHGRDQAEDALVGHVLEESEAEVPPRAIGEPHEQVVELSEVEQRRQSWHEDRRLDPEPVELAPEVPGHGALAVLRPLLDPGRDHARVNAERHDLGREEPLDHSEERQELLAALEPDDQIGLEHLNLLIVQDLSVDARHETARVHHDEVRPRLLGLPEEAGHAGHDLEQVALGRGRAHEPHGILLRHGRGIQVLRVPDHPQRHGRGRPDRLLPDVGIEERRRSPGRDRGLEEPSRQGALARVEPAEQHDGVLGAHRLLDERFVLVHLSPPVSSLPEAGLSRVVAQPGAGPSRPRYRGADMVISGRGPWTPVARSNRASMEGVVFNVTSILPARPLVPLRRRVDPSLRAPGRRSPGSTASSPPAARCRPSRSRSRSGPGPEPPAGPGR